MPCGFCNGAYPACGANSKNPEGRPYPEYPCAGPAMPPAAAVALADEAKNRAFWSYPEKAWDGAFMAPENPCGCGWLPPAAPGWVQEEGNKG